MARAGENAVSCHGVLWRSGRRAGDEGVSSQDHALVFQGVLSGAAGDAGGAAGCRAVLALSMRETSEDEIGRASCRERV